MLPTRSSTCSEPTTRMVYSVPAQTFNERGVEGLPQSLSRMHTAWYKPSNSGAINQQTPAPSSWQRSLPPGQQTEALAAKAAQKWLGNPANKMQLPSSMFAADKSGDGVIDRSEFEGLMKQAGAVGDTSKLFASVDADGDGVLTADEVRTHNSSSASSPTSPPRASRALLCVACGLPSCSSTKVMCVSVA